MTPGQRRALETLLPRFGLVPGEASLDLKAVFGRAAPVVCEIGFGNGEALATMAGAHPELDFLGIEVHRPGIGSLLRRLDAERITNVRVIAADAKEVFTRNIPDGALHAVHLFFPDPWPKKRHHKRRLIQPEFTELLRAKLAAGGYVHVASDWEDYARHALTVLGQTPGLLNAAGAGAFSERPLFRPPTRYERRGERLGHRVYDLHFVRGD